ncbi:MAG: hypothetical protein V1732_05210 [Patescibacteria group bacterium]
MLYVIILILPLLIYAVLSAIILFHLKKYGIAGDFTRQIIILFFMVSVILIFFTALSFFNIPWDELNLADMLQDTRNDNPYFYQP